MAMGNEKRKEIRKDDKQKKKSGLLSRADENTTIITVMKARTPSVSTEEEVAGAHLLGQGLSNQRSSKYV